MASRLDRLFILLETGTNPVTKRAAAQQLGEAQRLHPHELHHLLGRVSVLLKSPQWDTRVSAAHAVKAILSQVPVWNPEPIDENINDDDTLNDNKKNYLTLENFDMSKILSKSNHLTGSEGTEYDLVIADGDINTMNSNSEKILATKLGIDPKLMDTSELFTVDDLTLPVQQQTSTTNRVPINETLEQSESGLSRREMNRARRKARQSLSKQKSREPDDQQQQQQQQQVDQTMNNDMPNKKIKLDDNDDCDKIGNIESSSLPAPVSDSKNIELNISNGAVPDGTGSWPETTTVWPLETFSESLCQDLFSQKWEVRHGAATALRELVNIHGKGAGKKKNQTKKQMDDNHRKWIVDASLRLLCVLGLDRFGDFVSDQVVAPVRETCAQALGSLVLLMPSDEGEGVLGILKVMLTLLEHNDWEARHGSLLALKYLLAVRDDLLNILLPQAFEAAMKGLADSVDDVGAAAASALIPVASHLPKLLKPQQLQLIVTRLWELLKEQDDLAAACNSFMGLLASILSLSESRKCLPPQPLSQVLPRLWPFLGHSSSSVRKATLQTLETLTGEDSDSEILNPKERWGDDGSIVLQEALRHVFQRVLIEHVDKIQAIAEKVWENLVTRSDLELLLHAACPLVSTWLCLAMQPDHAPFNPAQLYNISNTSTAATTTASTTTTTNSPLKATAVKTTNGQTDGQSDSGSSSVSLSGKSTSELKVYIGGIETVPQNIRLSNTIRARIMAGRMLGLLSRYVVKPAPGVIYTADIPSPGLCYARVLLAHLASRSSLQRTVVGITIAHWAYLDHPNPPQIPDILRDKLLTCLNECVYYDEIANTYTRLLHESKDYIATLKHYKLALPIDTDKTNGILTLEQISNLSSLTITNMQSYQVSMSPTTSKQTIVLGPNKLKPKLLQSLEERRKALEIGANTTSQQQQTLNIMSMAALAGAATMLHCLPEPPRPLNPLVKPLMEAIKREDDENLQKLASLHLSHLINLCTDRIPSPNNKIITNLCTFLCSDIEFTPRVCDNDIDPFDGILTLTSRQRNAERTAYRGTGINGNSSGRGPGRPPATEIPLEELLAYEEPEAKASRTRRRGATYALKLITKLIGANIPNKLPSLWNIIIKNNYDDDNDNDNIEKINNLIFGLQVFEIISTSLDETLLLPLLDCLPNLCKLLSHKYKAVRHMASRCISTLAVLNTNVTMDYVVKLISPYLETNINDKIINNNNSNSNNNNLNINSPNLHDVCRQGAAEALTCIVESLGVNVVPYAVLFMVPLLGRMSDQNKSVRLACNATFATLVQLLPLDPGSLNDPPNLVKEKTQERKFLEQLLNPKSIPDTKLTINVDAELRSYQQQGLNWLDFLNRYRLHGILCDDMGLGKTLQTLCIIGLDHNRNINSPPSIVLCPPTLTGHWVYEAEKFMKKNDLSVIQYVGIPPEREKLRLRLKNYKLVVASYDIVRKDIEFFESIQWNYCVLDEGHIIKNGKTKSAKAVKRLRSYHRLILSGTPVQNDVLELWSLFDFLMPGFLGSEKQFAAKYSRPIIACREPKAGKKEQEAGALAMESLHRQVLPFLLRRNKEDVIKDLPPKITQDYYCDLSPLQKILYEDFRVRHSSTLITADSTASTSSIATETASTSTNDSQKGHVFEALRYLRNVCNHPKLVLGIKHPLYNIINEQLSSQQTTLGDIEHGAKLPALKQLLLDCGIGLKNDKTLNEGQQSEQQLVSQHRALIFCQLKTMLDIVEKDLLAVHLPSVTYLRLDGSIPAQSRHSVVTRFNSDPSIDVLLLTTQVGGLGLNLTGADTVIFVEHDWNPMKDLQAMDRAHRIGQKKVVNVYRLITRSTVEEKIMGLQKFKLRTAKTIISNDNASLETMGTHQLLDLFSLDNGKDKKTDESTSQQSSSDSMLGLSKTVMDILPELWEQQQYDDEFDINSFLTNLKGTNS
ncbi:hypothetical protein HCN44_006551 [Aphidius gifuensis]|uniref:TATA-binding protein-associated factor n=1 Tax=Aphidius gifuensis TaxID=684658 RepID=A0A835CSX2_APHGI|nr:TATA-binding protein-associated factor 172 [Aphidius gifuensis]KAF7995444.1 hypothetical protein HCN44_006551 [Aphidius gifuensis]